MPLPDVPAHKSSSREILETSSFYISHSKNEWVHYDFIVHWTGGIGSAGVSVTNLCIHGTVIKNSRPLHQQINPAAMDDSKRDRESYTSSCRVLQKVWGRCSCRCVKPTRIEEPWF
jgi:hypothetical protein